MQVKILSFSDRKRWNDFVASTFECPILQSYEWGELKGEVGWQPLRLALEEENQIVAGISILKRKIPGLPFSLFYAPRGPVLDFKKEGLLKDLLKAINILAEEQPALALKIDPEIKEDDAEVIQTFKNLRFSPGRRQIQPRVTFYLDLTADLDNLLTSFEEKTRYNIRLSEKKGVEVRDSSTEEGVNIFYKIYQETAQREKFLIHPLSYYQKLKRFLIDRGLAKVFLGYYQGLPIAGIFIFTFGSKVWYMYGASASDHRNVMPNHGLHWQVIKWAKEKGFKIYDLWGIPAHPTERHPLWGVYRFKKGFNGKLVKFIGIYDLPYQPFLYKLFDSSLNLYQNLRSLLTKGRIEDSLGE